MNDSDLTRTRVAIPITAPTAPAVESEWEQAAALAPDLIEWRLDALDPNLVDDNSELGRRGRELRGRFAIPVLATVRTDAEGGGFEGTTAEYQDLVRDAATWADYVDVEVGRVGSTRLIADLLADDRFVASVVGSFHDFHNPPSGGITQQLLEHMQQLGCAVAKVAWMVKGEEDLEMVLKMQDWAFENLQIPAVIIGMGPAGQRTRLGRSAQRSAFTFARGIRASAPGQPTIEQIRSSVAEGN